MRCESAAELKPHAFAQASMAPRASDPPDPRLPPVVRRAFRGPPLARTVQYSYSTVLHGARMYTVVNTGTVQNSIQVQVLDNTLKLGVR